MSNDETAGDVLARQRAENAEKSAGTTKFFDRAVVRWELTLADGTKLEREWTMQQVSEGAVPPAALPTWLDEPLKSWAHPQDPVTYTGKVQQGHEDEARALLELPA